MAAADEHREDEPLPGFRFYPTEEELISFYLDKKLQANSTGATSTQLFNNIIPVADLYSNEPWDLPKLCGERCKGDTEQWFFFVAQQARETRGGRPNRTTSSGYWKATGSPCYVYSSTKKKAIGVKKTMVFYKGKAPTWRKTEWKMNEYKAIKQEDIVDIAAASPSDSQPGNINLSTIPKLRHEMSVCRVYVTSRNSRAFDRRPSSSLAAAFQAPAPAAGSPTHDLQAAAVPSSSTSRSHDQQRMMKVAAGTVSRKSCSSSSDSSEDPGDRINNRSSAVNDQDQHISNTTFDDLDNDTGLWDWPEHFKWADD